MPMLAWMGASVGNSGRGCSCAAAGGGGRPSIESCSSATSCTGSAVGAGEAERGESAPSPLGGFRSRAAGSPPVATKQLSQTRTGLISVGTAGGASSGRLTMLAKGICVRIFEQSPQNIRPHLRQ